MYEYLIGTITQVFPAYIVVENNGIGYLINVANPFRFKSDETKQEKIYLHQIVRENEIVLYGFSDFNEKQLFLKLISVSGIGPKSALAILPSFPESARKPPSRSSWISRASLEDLKAASRLRDNKIWKSLQSRHPHI